MIVGAGDGLAIVLAVGTRPEDERISYPSSQLAERYGASAVETTTDPQDAYSRAGTTRPKHERPAYWDKLPGRVASRRYDDLLGDGPCPSGARNGAPVGARS